MHMRQLHGGLCYECAFLRLGRLASAARCLHGLTALPGLEPPALLACRAALAMSAAMAACIASSYAACSMQQSFSTSSVQSKALFRLATSHEASDSAFDQAWH